MNIFQKHRAQFKINIRCYQQGRQVTVRKKNSKWKSQEVRTTFLDFFKERNHTFVHSSSVLPNRDEGSYFINAGMNQFKPLILGTVDKSSEMANYRRVVNSQKCIRVGGKHNDLEDVGRDTYHHTFFEMLGSWSFGDYFKEKACSLAWDLMTGVYRLPADRLYVTYFAGSEALGLEPDLECKHIWRNIGVPESRVLALGVSDNFWDMGETGPCGPCTEIHYDSTGQASQGPPPAGHQTAGLLELWNLVFMQFDRQPDGTLADLPRQHVDTGMGLERITAVLQGSNSNYDTDLFQPLFSVLAKRGTCAAYGSGEAVVDTAYRLVADHARMFTVAISDGLLPARGESQAKLKHVIHRSVRQSADVLRAPQGTLASLVPTVISSLGEAFPELKQNCSYVQSVVNETEHRYLSLIEDSEKHVKKALTKFGLTPGDAMSCEQMYELCDGRFGRQVPLDILGDILHHSYIACDLAEYEDFIHNLKTHGESIPTDANTNLLNQLNITWLEGQNIPPTDVTAVYDYTKIEDRYVYPCHKASVLAIRAGRAFVDELEHQGQQPVLLILDRTCFYAEKGGQVGDKGFIRSVDGAVFEVEDTQITQNYVQHIGVLRNGKLKVGAQVDASLNQEVREGCTLHHSATHILHLCLKKLCGACQNGSLVTPSSLHFEFTTLQNQMSSTYIVDEVTAMANQIIKECQTVFVEVMDFHKAKNIEGLSFLASKAYPQQVRVVRFGGAVGDEVRSSGENSVELCGGTHVFNSGDLKSVSVISFEGEGQFSKRLVAVTGDRALQVIQEGKNLKERVNHLKEIVQKKINKDQWISLRKEIGQRLGAAVIPKTDRTEIVEELGGLDRRLNQAAAGREGIRQQMMGVLEGEVDSNILHLPPAKPRDVIKVLGEIETEMPLVIFFQNVDQKSVVNVVCSVPKKQNSMTKITAEDLAKEVCKHTGGTMQVPKKVHSQQLNDFYVVKYQSKTAIDKEVIHIDNVVQNFLYNNTV